VIEGHPRIRLVIVDRQVLFRESVRLVLESEPDFAVVGEAEHPLEGVAKAERSRPDVLLMEIGLPPNGAITAVSRIRERLPDCRILVLSRDPDVATLIDVLEAGANGYLGQNCPIADLIAGIRAVYEGEAYVPASMLKPLLEELIRGKGQQEQAVHRLSRLTNREREILVLLADGGDNRAIARALRISPQTARTHIQNILTKLGVHSRLEAAAFLTQNGMRGALPRYRLVNAFRPNGWDEQERDDEAQLIGGRS
jgi:two-component system, NarL family, nitrate/nitrite response regulator NarL